MLGVCFTCCVLERRAGKCGSAQGTNRFWLLTQHRVATMLRATPHFVSMAILKLVYYSLQPLQCYAFHCEYQYHLETRMYVHSGQAVRPQLAAWCGGVTG